MEHTNWRLEYQRRPSRQEMTLRIANERGCDMSFANDTLLLDGFKQRKGTAFKKKV